MAHLIRFFLIFGLAVPTTGMERPSSDRQPYEQSVMDYQRRVVERDQSRVRLIEENIDRISKFLSHSESERFKEEYGRKLDEYQKKLPNVRKVAEAESNKWRDMQEFQRSVLGPKKGDGNKGPPPKYNFKFYVYDSSVLERERNIAEANGRKLQQLRENIARVRSIVAQKKVAGEEKERALRMLKTSEELLQIEEKEDEEQRINWAHMQDVQEMAVQANKEEERVRAKQLAPMPAVRR